MARKREPLKDRILRSHEKAQMLTGMDECWLWRGSKTRDGYGVMTVGRKQVRAHRAAFEAWHGPIPTGALVCHRCDVSICVNPGHLFAGSPRDNTRDMIAKGRNRPATVETHSLYKLRDTDRTEIRRRRANGETLARIAESFGVAFQTISEVCRKEIV